MKKFVIQIETGLDLLDIAKLLASYERAGSLTVKSVIQDVNSNKKYFDFSEQIEKQLGEGENEQSREK